MRHVERHIVKENNPIWKQIDSLCFLSKNLYNYANYQVRQSFIFEQVYLGFNQVYHLCKKSADYRALPAKVSQQVLRTLDKNWKSFMKANCAYFENPDKFTRRPKLPKYKHKIKGRNLLTYTIQAISKTQLKLGIVKLSGTDIEFPTQAQNIAQARIIPKVGQYIIEVVYEQAENHTVNDPKAVAAIDIGVDNLAALTSNQTGFIPILINGRPLKSLNQFYNKNKAQLSSKASFLNLDYIPTYERGEAKTHKFSGYRESRGMYKIKGDLKRINADVNGSYNIMRKVIPTVFDGGIEKAARWAGFPT